MTAQLRAGPEHLVARPGWQCRQCAAPWPCPPAQAELGEQFANDPTALSVLMAAHLADALREISAASSRQLWDRFLAWTRPARTSPRSHPPR